MQNLFGDLFVSITNIIGDCGQTAAQSCSYCDYDCSDSCVTTCSEWCQGVTADTCKTVCSDECSGRCVGILQQILGK